MTEACVNTNLRMIDDGHIRDTEIDDDICVFYVFSTNKEWNIIKNTSFLKYSDETHLIVNPSDDDQSACTGIPIYIISLQRLIESKEAGSSEAFYNSVIDNCGYVAVSCKTRHIDAA